MGCVVNGPGESKHANIGISLPGTFEEPKAPVYVDGKLFVTWYPIEGIQMKVGWNFLAFFDTVQADQQVDFDFRSLDPNWKNRFVRFLDGLNAGIGFIF